MLKLALEVTDNPELYDFLFGSGVVRDEDGVDVLRGSIEGDFDVARMAELRSTGWLVGGVCGIGGGP